MTGPILAFIAFLALPLFYPPPAQPPVCQRRRFGDLLTHGRSYFLSVYTDAGGRRGPQHSVMLCEYCAAHRMFTPNNTNGIVRLPGKMKKSNVARRSKRQMKLCPSGGIKKKRR
ncbi:hypothetical protein F5Y14DRAFT_283504 [Nemania sp. NC0429]|nr:hypothetical protein F5Y14DRAFT_283504 [Nemania sp. NC0429]